MRFHILYSVCKQIPKQSTSKQYRLFCSATTPKYSSVVKIHSALDLGCIDYSKSWAWQHVFLSRRLALRRRDQPILVGEEDSDCILLLEHTPVYTLGRGSDENHLTFLRDDSSEAHEIRSKLSRKVRGPGSARLSIDRQVDNLVIAELPMNQAVDRLCQLAGTPVIAPNNVPIYRVERGGEVTFHGPCQLVVYPLLDLRRPPYQQDLHWYLRMIEEVIIQTLQHYNIESVRDEENTGNINKAVGYVPLF
jgi:lipoyl(octanoyl) transferase